jgi:hypothetical protein
MPRLCEEPGCDTRPSYGKSGTKEAKFCAVHKQATDVNLVSKKCQHPAGCDTLASYGKSGTKEAKFCVVHKQATDIDLKHKKCQHPEGCDTRPNYGKAGHPTSRCAQHKTTGMIMHPNAKCRRPKCKSMAIWGLNFIPLNCDVHKQEGQQNLVEERCVSCQLMYILDDTGVCENCNPENFKRARLAKQTGLMNYLDEHGFQGDSTDRMIDGGQCGKERPDRVFDFGDKIVIMECDEHAHRDRPCLCEQTRMVNIGQAYGGIPVYFIRWNPDVYAGGDAALSTRYQSAVAVLRDIKNGRMKLPQVLTSALYLYYDGWKGLHNEEWHVLMQ